MDELEKVRILEDRLNCGIGKHMCTVTLRTNLTSGEIRYFQNWKTDRGEVIFDTLARAIRELESLCANIGVEMDWPNMPPKTCIICSEVFDPFYNEHEGSDSKRCHKCSHEEYEEEVTYVCHGICGEDIRATRNEMKEPDNFICEQCGGLFEEYP